MSVPFLTQSLDSKGTMITFRKIAAVLLLVFLAGCRPEERENVPGQDGPNDLKERNVPMPDLPKLDKKFWINAEPGLVDNLKGKVVLVDFWEYTCVNCIRTLPYIKEWNKRYADRGLVILGVHAPEFEFGKKRENVEKAVRDFELHYPIVLDNDYVIWNKFGNRYWPAKYLFDKNGILRYQHYGEGSYGETESAIQKLLREIDKTAQFPSPLEPLRAEDKPGAVCYRATPETYLGYKRGRIGNKEGYKENREVVYTDPGTYKDDTYYLAGRWHNGPQSVRLASRNGEPGAIIISYEAAEANLVIHSEAEPVFKVFVEQDGKPVAEDNRGADIKVDNDGRTFLLVDSPRMYYITKNKQFGRHLLKFSSNSNNFGAYAFTFTTMCMEPEK